MARNEVYRVGANLPVAVPDLAPGSNVDLRITDGVPLRIGGLNAVTVSTKGGEAFLNGYHGDNYDGNVSVALDKAFLLPVTIVGGPLGFGTPVYLVTATGLLSTASASATPFGWIVEESPVATGTQVPVVVKISQSL